MNGKILTRRDTEAIPCSCCGGYSGRKEPTKRENELYDCGRGNCCVAAFECMRCGHREAYELEAPEMDME